MVAVPDTIGECKWQTFPVHNCSWSSEMRALIAVLAFANLLGQCGARTFLDALAEGSEVRIKGFVFKRKGLSYESSADS